MTLVETAHSLSGRSVPESGQALIIGRPHTEQAGALMGPPGCMPGPAPVRP